MAPEQLEAALARIETRQANTEKLLEELREINAQRKCGENTEKIKQLEWFMRLVLGTSLAALIKAFWFTGGSH